MLPEVQKYIEAVDAIDKSVRELRAEVNNADGGEQYRSAHRTWRDAERAMVGEKYAAALVLGETTENSIISYIVKNYLDDHNCEVIELLKVAHEGFPAMEKLATSAGWCSVWEDAVEKALKDEVIKLDGVTFATAKLRRELRREMGTYEVDATMKIVDELAEARVKVALDKAAEITENALCP